MQSAIGSLSIIFNGVDAPNVHWKGVKVIGVISMLINTGGVDDRIVRFVVDNPLNNQEHILSEMISSGISIKKVRR